MNSAPSDNSSNQVSAVLVRRRIGPWRWLFSLTLLTALALILTLASCSREESEEMAIEPDASGSEEVIAGTEYGKVRGYEEDGVLVFRGIRYGADTSTTRFQAPAEPEPWEGVKDAMAFGDSARQVPTGSGGGLFTSWKPDPEPGYSEDCLFLNVWTPALRDGKKRPVMVWFHGGGFSSGNGSSQAYDGVRLASKGDVVVVTVNHRLNIFAHLYLAKYGEQFSDSGNAGILDLVHSLEWVRDNIEEFGGDPNNVLIFGESGGGAKVSVLMAMDSAKGLFHRAVIQSGPRLTNTPADAAAKGASAVVEQLGLSEDSIDRILTMPAADIEAAARTVAAAGVSPTWTGPVSDGKNFKRQPFDPDAPPQAAEVPLLIGTTRTENSLLIGSRNPDTFNLTWETLPAALASYANGKDVNAIIAKYRELQPEAGAPEIFFTATTDAGFLNRSIELADKKSAQAAPVYFYLLNWNTPVDEGKWFSPHALEIGMVFDNVAKSESMSGIGDEQQKIADMMSNAWLNFARSGNPNHDGIPQWPPYTAETRNTMIFDNTPRVSVDPRGELRKMFLD